MAGTKMVVTNVTSTAYTTDPLLQMPEQIGYVTAAHMTASAPPIFVSFDGINDHGKLDVDRSPSIAWQQPKPLKVWARLGSAGAAAVQIIAETL